MRRTQAEIKAFEQKVLELEKTLVFQTAIAKELGVAQSYISTILKKHGIHHERGFHLHSDQKRYQICELTLKGYCSREIGQIMGISPKVVQKAIRRYKDDGLLPQDSGWKRGGPGGQYNGFFVDGQHHNKHSVREAARYKYRAVAEEMLGRPLLPGEDVHHVDFDPGNNEPANLRVLPRAEHIQLHMDHLKQLHQQPKNLPDLGHSELPKYRPLKTGELP